MFNFSQFTHFLSDYYTLSSHAVPRNFHMSFLVQLFEIEPQLRPKVPRRREIWSSAPRARKTERFPLAALSELCRAVSIIDRYKPLGGHPREVINIELLNCKNITV